MNLYLMIGLAIFALYIVLSLKMVRQTERGLVERFGKYNRFATPGLHFIPLGIDQIHTRNITENMVDSEQQEIITKDNLNAKVDVQVYFKIKDDERSVKDSEYQVNDVEWQIANLARTTLRNVIGNMELKEANSGRAKINNMLMKTLETETKGWGVTVVRTELKDILPPEDVQASMNKVVKAQNEKTAAIDLATAAETVADGEKRAVIKKAEGSAKSVEIEAKAKAEAIKVVNEAAEKYFKTNAQKLKAMEVTENSLKNNTKIVLTTQGVNPNVVFGEGIIPIKS